MLWLSTEALPCCQSLGNMSESSVCCLTQPEPEATKKEGIERERFLCPDRHYTNMIKSVFWSDLKTFGILTAEFLFERVYIYFEESVCVTLRNKQFVVEWIAAEKVKATEIRGDQKENKTWLLVE